MFITLGQFCQYRLVSSVKSMRVWWGDVISQLGRWQLMLIRSSRPIGWRNVWTQWQNHLFTGTSTVRSSTRSPSATPGKTQLRVNSVAPAPLTLIAPAWERPWSLGTPPILSDILSAQTETFQTCERPMTNDHPLGFQLSHAPGFLARRSGSRAESFPSLWLQLLEQQRRMWTLWIVMFQRDFRVGRCFHSDLFTPDSLNLNTDRTVGIVCHLVDFWLD